MEGTAESLKTAEKAAPKKPEEESGSTEKTETPVKTSDEDIKTPSDKSSEKPAEKSEKEDEKPQPHLSKKASAYSQFLNELGGDENAPKKEETKPTEKSDSIFEAKTISQEPAKEHLDSVDKTIKETSESDTS